MVRERVHFTFPHQETAPIKTRTSLKNPLWCAENHVDEIWQRIVRYMEHTCRNPKYDGFTADEIMDSLFPDEDQMRWEAARHANAEQENKKLEEEERKQWEFPVAGGLSMDLVISRSLQIGDGARNGEVEITQSEKPETLTKNPMCGRPDGRSELTARREWVQSDDGGDWSGEDGDDDDEVLAMKSTILGESTVIIRNQISSEEHEAREIAQRVPRGHWWKFGY
ncbi:hypothetical protein HOY82DRAFT_538247 [Tuber indicum]|nr:hypothetical protein HOY82DRAFT_538247 [Tuber indicum]